MLLARSKTVLKNSKLTISSVMLSAVMVSTLMISGCASKPQVGGTQRYMVAPEFYTVRSGDTLSKIAMRYGLNYTEIAALNDIAPPYRIYVNQSLRLKPSSNRQIVRSTTRPLSTVETPIQRQTVQLPSAQPPVSTTQVRTTTPAPVSTTPSGSSQIASSNLRWVKPSNGPVIANFNLANNIKGLRFGGNVGDPIYAAADGQVVYAADGLKEYGNLVLIKHIDGYITAYAHNSRMLVKSGQNVKAGQQIAEMGATGTTRTMLEFQIRLDGKPINPANILPVS